jgi:hypothetical protein
MADTPGPRGWDFCEGVAVQSFTSSDTIGMIQDSVLPGGGCSAFDFSGSGVFCSRASDFHDSPPD